MACSMQHLHCYAPPRCTYHTRSWMLLVPPTRMKENAMLANSSKQGGTHACCDGMAPSMDPLIHLLLLPPIILSGASPCAIAAAEGGQQQLPGQHCGQQGRCHWRWGKWSCGDMASVWGSASQQGMVVLPMWAGVYSRLQLWGAGQQCLQACRD